MKRSQRSQPFPQLHNTALSVLLLVVASQLNVNLIINGFKISMAIIFLPLLSLLIENFRPLAVTLFAAPAVMAVRCLAGLIQGEALNTLVSSYAPEMVFFLLYGLLFSLYQANSHISTFGLRHVLPLAAIDLASNLGEMVVRMGVRAFSLPVLGQLTAAAAARTLLTSAVLGAFTFYGVIMMKKEEQARYRNLVMLISQLKSEVVWMDKNAFHIEDTMSTSYQLYSELLESGNQQAAQKALTIAKDVHEIKKEYYLIMRGISSALEQDREERGMWLKSILQILEETLSREIGLMGKEIRLSVECGENFYTDKHYYLMSVFRNLMTNAAEAATGPASIALSTWAQGEDFLFAVKDSCGGIPADSMDSIFLPGFTTKISYTTGQVGRGLGLNLVKDLVEEKLGGALQVCSQKGCTQFTIRIPKQNLEVATR